MNTTPINWEAIAGGLAIAAALAALIAWQVRGSADKCRGWLGSSAMTLEALAMAMAVFWAVKQGAGILTLFFAGGFIGLALSKAVTISALVHAYQIKRHSAFVVTLAALVGAYLTVYSAGVFEGTMHSAKTQGEAAAVSAPVQAVEAEIASVQARINGLAGFADASKAQQDEQTSQSVQASLAAKRAALAACPKNYVTNCIKPLRAEIAALEHNNGTGYASRNAQYNGLQAHLATLQRQRAELLSAGGGVETANSADDRLIMWLFGLDSIEQAASVKWLIFVAVFDCLSLLLRLGGELLLGQDHAGNAARRMRALVESGLTTDQAAQAMGGHQTPAYRYGGAVTHTGPAVVHGTPERPEYVLSPEMTDHMGGAEALDTIRDEIHGKTPAKRSLNDVKSTLNVPLSVTSNVPVKRVPAEVAGKRGKGRQGLIDTCLHCGQDYTVKAWTQVCCCPDCTAQLSGYADQAARQAAWNKGKKSA